MSQENQRPPSSSASHPNLPSTAQRLWPQTVPSAGELPGFLRSKVPPPAELKAFVASNGAWLSDTESAAICGTPMPHGEELRFVATVRWRLAAALSIAPPLGSAVHEASLNVLLQEADAALTTLTELLARDGARSIELDKAKTNIAGNAAKLFSFRASGARAREASQRGLPRVTGEKPVEKPKPAAPADAFAGNAIPKRVTRERLLIKIFAAIAPLALVFYGYNWWAGRPLVVPVGPVSQFTVAVVGVAAPRVTLDVHCPSDPCPRSIGTSEFAGFALLSATAAERGDKPIGAFAKLFALDRAGVVAKLDGWRGPNFADLVQNAHIFVSGVELVPGAAPGFQRVEIAVPRGEWLDQFAPEQSWPVTYAGPAPP